MEINYDDLVERIFSKSPQGPKSITLDFVERLSLEELFEFLLSFFTDGTKLLYGETGSDGKVQVDLNRWSQENVIEMKKYLAMIGFDLFVDIEDFNPQKNYPDDTLYQNNGLETVDIKKIEKLNKIGKLILFSNANHKHCIGWLEKLQISGYFSVIINSDTFNMYKPNPNLYKILIKNCGIMSRDTVFFFDDMQINLYPAHQLNWKTILIQKDYKNSQSYQLNLSNKNYIDNYFDNVNIAIDYVLFFIDTSS